MLLRDILRGTEEVSHVVETIVSHAPDIIVLQSIDYDAQGAAVGALSDLISSGGLDLPYIFVPVTNTGMPTGIDIDGDGRSNAPRDAQGYGRFPGQASIAILSRYPISKDDVLNFSDVLWRDAASETDLTSLIPEEAISLQRLASVSLAAIPIVYPNGRIWILSHHATPPVFDGPEDRNGYRNADENRFWLEQLAEGFINEPYVLAAQMNVDPQRGEGHHDVIDEVLSSPYFVDPMQNWPAQDNHSVTYKISGPGKLRASYVLPSPELRLVEAGMSEDLAADETHSRHRLVWIDVEISH